MSYCKTCLEKGLSATAYKPNGKGQAQRAPEGEECHDCYMESIYKDLNITRKAVYLKQEIGKTPEYEKGR